MKKENNFEKANVQPWGVAQRFLDLLPFSA